MVISKSRKWISKTTKEYKGFIVFIFIMMIFRSAIADWNTVPTGSMNPTIVEGDRIWINKLAYDVRVPFTGQSIKALADPQYADIVIIKSKVAKTRLVKRVIGLPGDSVAMIDNQLYINGKRLDYEFMDEITADSKNYIVKKENLFGVNYNVQVKNSSEKFNEFLSVVVPENQYLVLGDNRDNSADSRFIGFIDRDEIIGQTKSVVMSLNYDNFYIPRSDRFFKTL